MPLPFSDGTPYVVTQRFGENAIDYRRFGLAGHNGIDLAVPIGTPLLAVAEGEVWEVECDPTGFGHYVKLRTPQGEDWLYAHLSLPGLPLHGQYIGTGQPVAQSGNSGNSTGPHLHLGYRPQHWVRGGPYNGYADPTSKLDL